LCIATAADAPGDIGHCNIGHLSWQELRAAMPCTTLSVRAMGTPRGAAHGMATATCKAYCPAWLSRSTCGRPIFEDAMTRPRQTRPRERETRQEQTIDRMVEDTFPASDATQLPGRAAGAPAADHGRKDANREGATKPPGTIGNQGVAPSTRMREESVALGGNAVVTFRFDPDARRLALRFAEEGMALDANALDRLIAALSKKRAQMGE
jgi:hypothetical protein